MASVNVSNHFKRHDKALCDEPGSGGVSHTVDILTYTNYIFSSNALPLAYTFIYFIFHIHHVF